MLSRNSRAHAFGVECAQGLAVDLQVLRWLWSATLLATPSCIAAHALMPRQHCLSMSPADLNHPQGLLLKLYMSSAQNVLERRQQAEKRLCVR